MLRAQLFPRLVASLAAFAVIGNTVPAFAETAVIQTTYYETRPSIEQQIRNGKLLLANHGGESSSASLGAVDILGTQPGGGPSEAMSDSLWGNLILQMAYARDRELGRSAKKLKITDNLTLASIYGISGVSLAQSITSLSLIGGGHGSENSFGHASAEGSEGSGSEHGSEGGSGHSASSEGSGDSPAPSILGLVASGSTLLSLGLRFYFGRRYSKQIKRRQQAVKAKVEAILARLEKGESPEQLRAELVPLIGDRATKEFSQLWRSSHQVAAAGASG
jgi:hypothetical protein